jgi:hemerythrin-like domain-containing protein
MKRDANLIRLSRDHHRGLALAQRIERDLAQPDDGRLARLREDTIGFWQSSLLPHFHAECECLLTRLTRHVPEGDEVIRRTLADHLQVHSLLASLRDSDEPEDARAALSSLGRLLRDHIRWEEAVLFEAAQGRLTAAEMDRVGADLSERLPEIPPPPPW